MKIEYSQHINMIVSSLTDEYGVLPTHRIVEVLGEHSYNYEGRSYVGKYDIDRGVLILYITQKHRGKRFKFGEKVPVVFKVSETTKTIKAKNNKPELVEVLILE